jgi:hypothetical protein
MLRLILLATILLPLPALAQGVNPPQAAPTSPATPPTAAMQHHQPTEGEVEQREEARFGKDAAKRQGTEQKEIDQLYQDVMRRSTPPSPAPRP